MRVELVMGLLVLLVGAVIAEKTKDTRSSPADDETVPPADQTPSQPRHDQSDPIHPDEGKKTHQRGRHGSKAAHRKSNKEGQHEGARQHAGAAALKEEIMKIKSSDLPEEEKQARLHSLRQHVKGNQMLQTMPPEVRERHTEFQQAIKQIHEDPTLSDEERNQRVADEKARFKSDMEAYKASVSPEEIERMKQERRRTIEGHTAAAIAAKQAGNHKMAREYHQRAKMAAKGHPPPPQRKRRVPAKRPSLSEPDFF
ncbi:uncharacterized protein [Amphiura filiformis]|uniref:uncharacterized protein n=1 Tax=Amphiura filiformis TaxID=82378 RepID=UPI003B227F49